MNKMRDLIKFSNLLIKKVYKVHWAKLMKVYLIQILIIR